MSLLSSVRYAVLSRLLGATHAEETSARLHPQTVGKADEREPLPR
jgi:hypothetical protein